mmetsp:Transcript_4598/g.9243  ORF Transcript_4598/g.9243 Transcript_4598/m.9243 type:complete len:286 (+) Transcript_4598:403-1260(+)
MTSASCSSSDTSGANPAWTTIALRGPLLLNPIAATALCHKLCGFRGQNEESSSPPSNRTAKGRPRRNLVSSSVRLLVSFVCSSSFSIFSCPLNFADSSRIFSSWFPKTQNTDGLSLVFTRKFKSEGVGVSCVEGTRHRLGRGARSMRTAAELMACQSVPGWFMIHCRTSFDFGPLLITSPTKTRRSFERSYEHFSRSIISSSKHPCTSPTKIVRLPPASFRKRRTAAMRQAAAMPTAAKAKARSPVTKQKSLFLSSPSIPLKRSKNSQKPPQASRLVFSVRPVSK